MKVRETFLSDNFNVKKTFASKYDFFSFLVVLSLNCLETRISVTIFIHAVVT